MPTNNPRLNITLEPDLMSVVTALANQENISASSLGKELIIEALERREDKVLSALAETRDKKTTKKVSHRDAWK